MINPGTPTSTDSMLSVVDSTKQSPLAELVNLPKIDYQNRIKTRKARVLTSNECLRALHEKVEKKRQAEEEKKKKKIERELKRKQKEEEMRRKKEVRVQKAAMKELEKEAKQREKEAKQREKEAKQHEKEVARQKEAERNKRKSDNSSATRTKRSRITENIDNEIDNNRCCTCFGTYSEDTGTNREWVMCCCNRWIHEDCIDPADVDCGTNKLCPLC